PAAPERRGLRRGHPGLRGRLRAGVRPRHPGRRPPPAPPRARPGDRARARAPGRDLPADVAGARAHPAGTGSAGSAPRRPGLRAGPRDVLRLPRQAVLSPLDAPARAGLGRLAGGLDPGPGRAVRPRAVAPPPDRARPAALVAERPG